MGECLPYTDNLPHSFFLSYADARSNNFAELKLLFGEKRFPVRTAKIV